MNDKYLSVITNFGCHYSCPYCIVKNNHLNIPKTTIHGLNNLFSEIVKNRCNWVSLSGGGDVFCANSEDIDELSFRQMVDNHYRETYYCHDYLKAGHKKLWWYIEQNDYNLYYCQNHVYTEYKNIGGDSNG